MLYKYLICLSALCSNHYLLSAQNLTEITFGSPSTNERGMASVQLPSGTIFTIGDAERNQIGGSDIVLMRLDNSGAVTWEHVFGTTDNDYVASATTDGTNILICGRSYDPITTASEAFILLTDTLGQQIAFKAFNDNRNTAFESAEFLTDGFIAAGSVRDASGQNDFWVVKFHSLDSILWETSLGDFGNQTAMSAHHLPNGEFIAVGDIQKPDGKYTVRAYRLDANGAEVWESEVQTTFNGGCKNSLISSNGDIIIVGEISTPTSTLFDPYVIKMAASDGAVIWTRVINLADGATDPLMTIYEVKPNVYAMGGYGLNPVTNSIDFLRLYMDDNSNLIDLAYFGTAGTLEVGTSIIPNNKTGGIIMTGRSSTGSDTQFKIVFDDNQSPALGTSANTTTTDLNLYPNPLEIGNELHWTGEYEQLTIQNNLGTIVFEAALSPQQQRIACPTLPQGIYIACLKNKTSQVSSKLLITGF